MTECPKCLKQSVNAVTTAVVTFKLMDEGYGIEPPNSWSLQGPEMIVCTNCEAKWSSLEAFVKEQDAWLAEEMKDKEYEWNSSSTT